MLTLHELANTTPPVALAASVFSREISDPSSALMHLAPAQVISWKYLEPKHVGHFIKSFTSLFPLTALSFSVIGPSSDRSAIAFHFAPIKRMDPLRAIERAFIQEFEPFLPCHHSLLKPEPAPAFLGPV